MQHDLECKLIDKFLKSIIHPEEKAGAFTNEYILARGFAQHASIPSRYEQLDQMPHRLGLVRLE